MPRLTDVQRAEVERWWPLAREMAKSRAPKYWLRFEPEDVQGWAALGLIDAVLKFDGSWSPEGQRDLYFSVYARTRIAGAIVDGFRRESTIQRARRGKQDASLSPIIDVRDPTEPFNLGMTDGGIDGVVDRLEARSVIEAVIAELEQLPHDKQHPRKVEPADVVRLWVRGMSGREIARACGCDESRVSQILKQQVRPLLARYLVA